MALTSDERRFLRYWDEQRKGGKKAFVPVYTLGFFIMYFMGGVASGLLLSLPFIQVRWLLWLAVISILLAFFSAVTLWKRQSRRFRRIILRESTTEN